MVTSHIGGKLLLFQSAIPSLGVGKVKARENLAAYGTEREPGGAREGQGGACIACFQGVRASFYSECLLCRPASHPLH